MILKLDITLELLVGHEMTTLMNSLDKKVQQLFRIISMNSITTERKQEVVYILSTTKESSCSNDKSKE